MIGWGNRDEWLVPGLAGLAMVVLLVLAGLAIHQEVTDPCLERVETGAVSCSTHCWDESHTLCTTTCNPVTRCVLRESGPVE